MTKLARRQAWVGLLLASFELGICFFPSPYVRYALSFGLLWILPGLAWAMFLLGPLGRRLDRWCVALGLNLVLTPLVMLLLSYLPGPILRRQILLSMGVVCWSSVLATLVRHRLFSSPRVLVLADNSPDASEVPKVSAPNWLPWFLLFGLALLRVTNLSYSEFQGDEATVMIRAARILQGDPGALFEHNKGPSELLAVAAGWRLTGISNEWMARLPFSWANVLTLLAVFLIARRVMGTRAGLPALLLLGIEGYVLALGRIAQYQSFVMALSTLALLCALCFQSSGESSHATVAGVLMAGASLAHYDAVFVLAPSLLILTGEVWRLRRSPRVWLALGAGIVLSGAVVAAFYWPFVRSEYIFGASSYLAKRVGSGLRNNLASIFELSTVYDSVYLLAVYAVGVSVQIWRAWWRWGRGGRIASAALTLWASAAFGCSIGGWLPESRVLAPVWVGLPFWLLLVGALLAPGQSVPQRALWLWLAVPTSFYLFYVATPYTHVYTFCAPAAVLAAATYSQLFGWLRARAAAVRVVGYATAAALAMICGYYAIHVFVQHTPEYRRTFPEHKLPIYWTPYEEIPKFGLFGFPYRAGWKTVGYLYETGDLVGDYESNEEPPITNYYLRTASRWHCPTPALYITAVNVQDEIYIRWDQVSDAYRPAIFVTVEGEPKIAIHTIDAIGEPIWLPASTYGKAFDLGTIPEAVAGLKLWFPTMDEPETEPLTQVDALIGDDVCLVGYHLDTTEVVAGSYMSLTLVWEALSVDVPDYAIYTHLQGNGALWGQLDGLPSCGETSTASWKPGEQVVDLFRIPVRVDTPSGTYPLRVGLYDRTSLERLPVTSLDGVGLGDGAHLADITVTSSQ